MAYATVANWLTYCDTQIVGDLITDDEDETGLRKRPTRDEILASEIAAEILLAASGEVDSALRVGKRYTPDQLAGLTGNAAAKLRKMTCDIATAVAMDRRPERVTGEIADRYYDKAAKSLKELRGGEAIFGLDDETDVTAGLMSNSGPTSLDVQDRNHLPERMGRHIPDSKQRYPLSRG